MHFVGAKEPDVAVDARTGVPTAVLLLGVVDRHCNGVASSVEQIRDVVCECGISVVVSAERLAVDKHFGVHVYSLEVKAPTLRYFAVFVEVLLAECDDLPVPSFACRTVAGIITGRLIGFWCSFDTPVVWKVEYSPFGVVEVWFATLFVTVSLQESPSVIQQGLAFVGMCANSNKHCQQSCQKIFLHGCM